MNIYSNRKIADLLEGADLTNLEEVKRFAIRLPHETLVHLASQHIVQHAKNYARSEVRKVEVSATSQVVLRPTVGERKRKPRNIATLEKVSPERREVLYEAENALAEKGLHHQLDAVNAQINASADLVEDSYRVNSNKSSKAKIKLPLNVVNALEGTSALKEIVEGVATYNKAWEDDRKAVEEINRKAEEQLVESLGLVIHSYKETLHIEWTEELLESEFALADGTKVTWGDASAEQHELRAQMFESQAKNGIEGAARHRKALDVMRLAEVDTLREAV